MKWERTVPTGQAISLSNEQWDTLSEQADP
jgi:hypothetical protein